MKEGGFELRKWASNSVEFMNKINRDENINRSDSSNESNHTRKVLLLTIYLPLAKKVLYSFRQKKLIEVNQKWKNHISI